MLATSVRVRPCSDLASRDSSGRSTRISPFSMMIFIKGLIFWATLPLGPSTRMVPASFDTFTLSGTFTANLPMRDMVAPLPDRGDELAAQVLLLRLAVHHHALG